MTLDPETLLRRLNPYCAKALEAAASLCQTRAHPEITLEHWLLKLLEQGSGDITVISTHYQLDLDKIWQGLIMYLDELPHSVHQKPTLSPSLLAVLQAAWLKASLEDQEDVLRSGHILRALQEMPQNVKAQGAWPLLTLSSTALSRLRSKIEALSEESDPIADKGSTVSWEQDANQSDKTCVKHTAVLNRFTEDVTEKARQGKIDPIFGRDNEIRQMMDILSRRRKNNPILVGEPGVGKTALVEGLALRIVKGLVPKLLENVTILTLDLGLLQAGAGVKGEFEQRLKHVIEAVQASATPILLFIDEAHTIIGAGNSVGGVDAANLLKPALARGELRTIAATTWSEYKRYFERDAALERRFQKVKVDEPDDETACLMLRGLKSRYAKHHGVHILDSAVNAAVTLSRRYITGRQLPDKAVDLLDTAAARVRMSLDTVPPILTELQSKRAALKFEWDALHADTALGDMVSTERVAEIESMLLDIEQRYNVHQQQFEEEKKCIERLIELRQQYHHESTDCPEWTTPQTAFNPYQRNAPLLSLDVDIRSVASVIADWTGVPIDSLLKDEQRHLLTLENKLGQRVVGQNTALTAIAKRIRAAKAGLTQENAPLGIFLLVGPSGVGKTECALALADMVFGGERALITINMSEYQEAHTVSQLKGSPPGYVGYGDGGILTEGVRKRPYSVVLLDEVEKAHPDVLNVFYQVFDRGIMRDGEGREIDFRNTLILMTSNLGSDALLALFEQVEQPTLTMQHELLRPILREHFQPALLARFQTVIFSPLQTHALRQIVEMKFNHVAARLQRHYRIPLEISNALYDYLVTVCLLPDIGARNIDTILNQQILPIMSELLLSGRDQNQHTLKLDYTEQEGIVLNRSISKQRHESVHAHQ